MLLAGSFLGLHLLNIQSDDSLQKVVSSLYLLLFYFIIIQKILVLVKQILHLRRPLFGLDPSGINKLEQVCIQLPLHEHDLLFVNQLYKVLLVGDQLWPVSLDRSFNFISKIHVINAQKPL